MVLTNGVKPHETSGTCIRKWCLTGFLVYLNGTTSWDSDGAIFMGNMEDSTDVAILMGMMRIPWKVFSEVFRQTHILCVNTS